jgi:hypothetical protein
MVFPFRLGPRLRPVELPPMKKWWIQAPGTTTLPTSLTPLGQARTLIQYGSLSDKGQRWREYHIAPGFSRCFHNLAPMVASMFPLLAVRATSATSADMTGIHAKPLRLSDKVDIMPGAVADRLAPLLGGSFRSGSLRLVAKVLRLPTESVIA